MSENQNGSSGKGCMMVLGIISILAGIAAMGSPFFAGSIVITMIGISLMIGGVMELVLAFTSPDWKSGAWAFLGGLLAFVAGGLLIRRPMEASAVIGMILIIFFLVDGVARSILAFGLKPVKGWGWQLFSGIISILLGITLWQSRPLSGALIIGIVVGIRLLFAGFGMLFVMGAASEINKEINA